MIQEADLARIEGGQYSEGDVRALVREVRRQWDLGSGILAECYYWRGVVRRYSQKLWLECQDAAEAVRRRGEGRETPGGAAVRDRRGHKA